MTRIVAAALLGLAGLGLSAPAGASELTEERVREIAAEVAERVAREVAEEIAAEIAREAALEAVEEHLAEAGDKSAALQLTDEFLSDPEHIASGREIWTDNCALCHGARAYPGKAPKLRPKRYTPDFVYDRITNGFRKMPAWRDVYTDEERMALVAWILSDKFSP